MFYRPFDRSMGLRIINESLKCCFVINSEGILLDVLISLFKKDRKTTDGHYMYFLGMVFKG